MTSRITRRGFLSGALIALGAATLGGGGAYIATTQLQQAADAADTTSPRDMDGNIVQLEGDEAGADGPAGASDGGAGSDGVLGTQGSGSDGADGDAARSSSSYDSGGLPDKDTVRQMDIKTTPGRLRVPSVGLDVRVDQMSAVRGVITPPGFQRAYWVRNRGVPVSQADQGTVFLVTHSVRHGKAPGNYVINVKAGRSSVAKGAAIQYGGRTYTVAKSLNIEKGQLASTSEVWENSPGRLVLITCLQRTRGTSLDNVVIIADLV